MASLTYTNAAAKYVSFLIDAFVKACLFVKPHSLATEFLQSNCDRHPRQQVSCAYRRVLDQHDWARAAVSLQLQGFDTVFWHRIVARLNLDTGRGLEGELIVIVKLVQALLSRADSQQLRALTCSCSQSV